MDKAISVKEIQAGTIEAEEIIISSTTKGFLPPRMTTVQREAISSPETGLIVFDTTLSKLFLKEAGGWAQL